MLFLVAIMFSFGCFSPVKTLAVKIVSKMTYVSSGMLTRYSTALDTVVSTVHQIKL